MLYFFIIKQGFSDQHHRGSAFSFLPFPIETSRTLAVEIVCVCVCACVCMILQSVCMCVCVSVCFVNVCPFFFLSNPPLPTIEKKAEPQHLNKLISQSDHQNFYRRFRLKTKKNIFKKKENPKPSDAFVSLVTLESNSTTVFRHSPRI